MSELTTPQGTSEADILKRISLARGTSEPEQAPTEEPEAVDVSSEEEAPEDLESAPLETSEPEELDEPEESISVSEDVEEDLYVDYKGREINLKDVEEWEQGHLRQADYTRKTQELSEQRKAFDAEREEFTAKQAKLNDKMATLEAMIAEDTLTDEQLAEMREYEPEKYIAHQEKMSKRKDLLKAKTEANTSNVDIQKEQQLLLQNNPEWFENGQVTKAYEEDLRVMQDFGLNAGFTADELQGFNTARMYEVLKKAAKYDQLSKKNSAIEKKVRKAPVSTKPRKAAQPSIIDAIKKQEALVKRHGREADFVKLRQLKRQLQDN